MWQQRTISFSLTAILLFAFGCASANVDPPRAQANTGYVDLYSPTDGALCWDVAASKGNQEHFGSVFSDVKPVDRDLLRLAFYPGTVRLRVTFLNRVVTKPVVFDCAVQAGSITPVAISLKPVEQTTVVSKQTMIGGTPMGRGGRQTKVSSEETVKCDVSAEVGATFPYRPKTQIHYPNQ